MKYLLMILFFFASIDSARALSEVDSTSDVAATDYVQKISSTSDNESPYEHMKHLHVFSLRIPPRLIYSSEWKNEIDLEDPQLCQIGIKNHREKQNVSSNCDEHNQTQTTPADIAATAGMEDL